MPKEPYTGQRCVWLEYKITPKDQERISEEIKSWYNPDGTINVKKMCADIKRDLIEAHEKTMKWQREAIKHSVPTD